MNHAPDPSFTMNSRTSKEGHLRLPNSNRRTAQQMSAETEAIVRVGDVFSTPPDSPIPASTRQYNISPSTCVVPATKSNKKGTVVPVTTNRTMSSMQSPPPAPTSRVAGTERMYIPDIDTPETDARKNSKRGGAELASIPLPKQAQSTTDAQGKNVIKLNPRTRKFHDPLEAMGYSSKKFRKSFQSQSTLLSSQSGSNALKSSPLYSSDVETELIFQSYVTYIDDNNDSDGEDEEVDDGPCFSPDITIPNIHTHQAHSSVVALTRPRPIRRPLTRGLAHELIQSPKTTGSSGTLPTSICSAFAVKCMENERC